MHSRLMLSQRKSVHADEGRRHFREAQFYEICRKKSKQKLMVPEAAPQPRYHAATPTRSSSPSQSTLNNSPPSGRLLQALQCVTHPSIFNESSECDMGGIQTDGVGEGGYFCSILCPRGSDNWEACVFCIRCLVWGKWRER